MPQKHGRRGIEIRILAIAAIAVFVSAHAVDETFLGDQEEGAILKMEAKEMEHKDASAKALQSVRHMKEKLEKKRKGLGGNKLEEAEKRGHDDHADEQDTDADELLQLQENSGVKGRRRRRAPPPSCSGCATVDLDSDFQCPTGDPGNGWIEAVEVNTVTNTDKPDYLTTGELYKPIHFHLGTSSSFGTLTLTDDKSYKGGTEIGPVWQNIPSTLSVMKLFGSVVGSDSAQQYYEGNLMQPGGTAEFSQTREATYFWEINDSANRNCWVMGTYQETRAAPDRIRGGTGEHGMQDFWLRSLKMSVCKMVDSVPKCASKKVVASCWFKDSTGGMNRCNDTTLEGAILLARA